MMMAAEKNNKYGSTPVDQPNKKREQLTNEGEETSISALSAKLKGYQVKHIQPTPHWLFNERLLSEIYDETYPFEE